MIDIFVTMVRTDSLANLYLGLGMISKYMFAVRFNEKYGTRLRKAAESLSNSKIFVFTRLMH